VIHIDCSTCKDKPCCRYHGWKVFFLQEEREAVLVEYGAEFANRIDAYHNRANGTVYAVDLPCPFFEESRGNCQIYDTRPMICRVFPVEIEPVTQTTYVDQGVCPKYKEAQYNPTLVQIAVDDWCDRFWDVRSANK
jgi:Fe-S-cluster containining protein